VFFFVDFTTAGHLLYTPKKIFGRRGKNLPLQTKKKDHRRDLILPSQLWHITPEPETTPLMIRPVFHLHIDFTTAGLKQNLWKVREKNLFANKK
jgi:hypothetical protein